MNMKTLLIAIVTFVTNIVAQTTVRFMPADEEMVQKIHFYAAEAANQDRGASTNHFVMIEGQPSNPLSSAEGSFDYFMVESKNSRGYRILKMDSIRTDRNGMQGEPLFRDVLTNQRTTPRLQTFKGESDEITLTSEGYVNEQYHIGSFDIGEDTYHMAVVYHQTLSRPVVVLTWGEGSGYNDVGTHWDIFSTYIPTETSLDIGWIVDAQTKQVVEAVVTVASPVSQEGYTVQVSSDLKSWKDIGVAPNHVNGYLAQYWVPITGSGSFFRVVVK